MTAKGKLIRNIVIAAAAVALLGGGYYFALKWQPATEQTETKNEQQPDSNDIYIVSENAEDVARIHVVNSSAEYDIVRTENGDNATYEIPEITTGDGVSSTIGNTFSALIKMSATNEVGAADNKDAFGFTAPQAKYTVYKKDGSETTVLIGDEVPTGGEVYCMTDGGDMVYTIGIYKADIINRAPNDYRNISVMNIETGRSVTDFTLYKGQEMIIDIRLATDEENDKRPLATIWAMDFPWKDDVDDTNLVRLFDKLALIEATGFEDNKEAFAAEYRFDIATAKGARSFSIGGSAADGGTFLRDEASGITYIVGRELLDTIKSIVPNDFIGKIVKLADIEKVSRVKIRKDGAEYVMQPGDEEGKPYIINGEEVGEDSFKADYQKVLGVLFRERGEFEVSGEPYISIEYEFEDGTTDKVEYYEFDEREYIALRADGSTVKLLRTAVSEIESLFEE